MFRHTLNIEHIDHSVEWYMVKIITATTKIQQEHKKRTNILYISIKIMICAITAAKWFLSILSASVDHIKLNRFKADRMVRCDWCVHKMFHGWNGSRTCSCWLFFLWLVILHFTFETIQTFFFSKILIASCPLK